MDIMNVRRMEHDLESALGRKGEADVLVIQSHLRTVVSDPSGSDTIRTQRTILFVLRDSDSWDGAHDRIVRAESTVS